MGYGELCSSFHHVDSFSEVHDSLAEDLKPYIHQQLLFSTIFQWFGVLVFFSNGNPVFGVSHLNSFNEHLIWVTCVYFDQPLDYITYKILHFLKSNT